jgi:tricarballylate dehydrogenase
MERARYDVAVIGGGNAALCAALTAREAGRSVMVLECAPREFRGGNSRHTRNLRCAHASRPRVLTDSYSEDEFLSDLLRVTGDTDERLAQLVVRASAAARTGWRDWRRFQSSLRGTLHLGRTNAFFLGGGKALMNSYYAAARRLGIDVRYDAEVVGSISKVAPSLCDRQSIGRSHALRAKRSSSRPAGSRRISNGCETRGAGRRTTS